MSITTDNVEAVPPATHPGLLLAVVLLATALAQFDFFVVNVAAPSLASELKAGPAALELVVSGYAFTFAGAMITGGRLGDLVGYRRMFVIGMLGFAFTSLLCGVAQNPAQLVGARLLQGLAGAMMVPQVLAIINTAIEPRHRPAAMGWFGAANGIASISGQVLGGLLIQANLFGLGWRIIFLLNGPVVAVAVPLALRFLPRHSHTVETRARLDLVGAGLISITMAMVLVPLTLGAGAGWPLWSFLCLGLAVLVGAATVWSQRSLRRRGGSPVMDLSLFAVSSFRSGMAATALFMGQFAAFMFTLTLMLQQGRGMSPFHAGLAFAPMGVAFVACSLLSQRVMGRIGPKVVGMGAGLTAVGLVVTAVLLLTAPEPGPLIIWLLAGFALVGAGNGFTMPPLVGLTLAGVHRQRAGTGAGMLTTVQQFAGAIGVAILGTLYFSVVSGRADSLTHDRAFAATLVVSAVCVLGVGALGLRVASAAPSETQKTPN